MYPPFDINQVIRTPYVFFTGKGGVGKTSIAAATAVALGEMGKQVLIVSTDPASNLQDVFEIEIDATIKEVSSVPNLSAVNLDPEAAASAYREKIVGPYRDKLPQPVVAQMEEQLSGACTVEIAAFDEFATLLTEGDVSDFDHIIFDTAPTGHTLRLLQLPTAWSGFIEESNHGASCLGPLSGLGEKKSLYSKTVEALANPAVTTMYLVTRPDPSSLTESTRASKELLELGITNQVLVMNGVFEPMNEHDSVAQAFHNKQRKAMESIDDHLAKIPIYQLPYISYSLTGVESLRNFMKLERFDNKRRGSDAEKVSDFSGLHVLVDRLGEKTNGVVMTMGKGGVGKTTIAATIALGLASKGKRVHLTTTDPAAHLTHVLRGDKLGEFLTMSRIDSEEEVAKYRTEVLAKGEETLDEEALAYLEEDLMSPCTEEIAVFRAFAQVVERSDHEFVVIDTAPTGHTLLLLDASQSYFAEIERSTGDIPSSVKKLLPRLRNREETDVVIVTLPEATPVLEATRLEEDLVRAGIDSSWWVINQSFFASSTQDPLLQARGEGEANWIKYVVSEKEKNVALIPWITEVVIGVEGLGRILNGK